MTPAVLGGIIKVYKPKVCGSGRPSRLETRRRPGNNKESHHRAYTPDHGDAIPRERREAFARVGCTIIQAAIGPLSKETLGQVQAERRPERSFVIQGLPCARLDFLT